jgi:hypothetical protein
MGECRFRHETSTLDVTRTSRSADARHVEGTSVGECSSLVKGLPDAGK